MFRRLGWIVASYFTRPLFLVLLAGGLLFVSITWFAKQPTTYDTNYPQVPLPHLFVDSKATLEAVRREGRQNEVDAIDLDGLWTSMQRPKAPSDPARSPKIQELRLPGAAFYRILEEFPNLRTVYASLHGNTTGADQIARLAHLEYLELGGTARADFSWMRPLANLRWLGLTTLAQPESLQALDALPKLETVLFRSRPQVTDEVLEVVAGLPHLKQLVLNFFDNPGPGAPLLTAAGFAALGRSESLETLYVGGFKHQQRGVLTALAKSALPRLDVEPSYVVRHLPTFFRVFPVVFFAMAIGFSLVPQFRGPLCRVAPGFVFSHVLVASAFFVATVLLAVARLISDGFDPLASTIVSAAVVAAAVCAASGDPAPPPIGMGRRWVVNLPKVILFFGAMSPWVVWEVGNPMLEGHRPWLLTVFAVIAVAAVGVTVHDLRRLVSSSSPAVLERGGNRRQLLQSPLATGWASTLGKCERQIDAWKSGSPRWTWWNRVRRWRVGNAPPSSVLFNLMFVLMLCVFYAAFVFLFQTMLLREPMQPSGTQQNFRGLSAQLLVAISIVVLLTAGRVVTAWRVRMLALPVEILRPYPRRAMQNEMIVAFVLDLVQPALLVAAIGAIGINLGSALRVDWARVPLDFVIVALACLATTVGLGSLVVVVKRDWLVALLVLSIGILVAAAIGALVAMQLTPGQRMPSLTPRRIESQLWLLVGVGIVLAGVMRHRFLAMEIGSRV